MATGIGILGFAHGHVQAYCTKWRDNPEWGVKAVAGWDHDDARIKQAADAFGLDTCASPAELLARDDVKAVVIASETSMHADLAVQAAEAGKTIILQKPMALTIPEADRIVDAVARTGVRFTMAWQMRVDPQNLKMKELMEDGTLGRVFMLRRRHGLGMCLNPAFADSWHVAPDKNRDIWADDASHPVDFIYWLFGAPESVTAEVMSLHDPRMPMDNGVVIFRYPGGPIVEVSCSFTNLASENTTEILGEKGAVVQNYGDGPSCNVPKPENACGLKWFLRETGQWVYSDLPVPAGHGVRIAGLAKPFADFVLGKGEPVATAEEGRTALRMNLACYVSTREGRRVSLDDPAIDAV
jgi:predicted dehydrogenase